MKIGIIGLGLIGGSVGLCLKDMKLIDRVYGSDISKENESLALNLGLVDEIITFDKMKEICDVIFLAIPVEAIVKTLQNLKDIKNTTTIIELGSTKEKIISSCPKEIRANLVAAHPMAGTENSGPKAAFKTLLQKAVVVICNDDDTANLHAKRAIEIFSYAGMKIVFMDAKKHDHHVALISHLPHVSRIAKSSPEMWSDIFKQNKENVLNSINSFKKELDFCQKLIEDEKWQELTRWLYEARIIRDFL